ncbi:18273_t:CDS:1 [Dentiscutata erythropus]|uniref:18273_t:CDS:1 n=1 Tax=Dentiscutata erythropus TaxID=1348616 RepID=A0A9N8WM08_9GLOM|nr:18273_t:CDS:1 [Dentiscutata erythropus]
MYLLDQTPHRKPEFVHETENITACPSIKVPYPPPISARELIFQKKNGEVPARAPNAFLIYRRVYVKQLQAQNYAFKMTDVSSMASSSWKSEPDWVKDEYLRIAGEAKNLLTTIRQKSLTFSRRKSRLQQNGFNNFAYPQKVLSTSQNEQVSLGKSQPYDAQASTVQTTDHFMSMDEYPIQPATFDFIEFDTWLANIHISYWNWNNNPIPGSNPTYDVDSSPFTDNKGAEEEIGLSYTTNICTPPFMNLTPSEMTVNHTIFPFRQ